MYWQDRGDCLCVQMTRHKAKKVTAASFQIFDLREKNVPVEVMEIDDKIVAFQWEPTGTRFAVIHTDSTNKTHLSVYSYRKKKIKHIGTINDRAVNALFWSPRGDYLVLAALGGSGYLECIDANSMYTLGVR
jgi:translation initiation factor 3 subunit B